MMDTVQVAKAIAQEHAESGGFRPLDYDIEDALREMFSATRRAAIKAVNGLLLPTDIRDTIVKALGSMSIPDLDDWKANPEDEDDGSGGYECAECGSTYHPSGVCPNKTEREEDEEPNE